MKDFRFAVIGNRIQVFEVKRFTPDTIIGVADGMLVEYDRKIVFDKKEQAIASFKQDSKESFLNIRSFLDFFNTKYRSKKC